MPSTIWNFTHGPVRSMVGESPIRHERAVTKAAVRDRLKWVGSRLSQLARPSSSLQEQPTARNGTSQEVEFIRGPAKYHQPEVVVVTDGTTSLMQKRCVVFITSISNGIDRNGSSLIDIP